MPDSSNNNLVSEIGHTWERYVSCDIQHVVPHADLWPHQLSHACWCRPEEDDGLPYDGQRWMHNAADGREQYEAGDRLHN